MNPIAALKLYRKVGQLVGQFQEATASYERTGMVSKSLWASKTFWVNAITIALEVGQLVSGLRVVPTVYMTLILGILNVVLRTLTDRPVHVLPQP